MACKVFHTSLAWRNRGIHSLWSCHSKQLFQEILGNSLSLLNGILSCTPHPLHPFNILVPAIYTLICLSANHRICTATSCLICASRGACLAFRFLHGFRQPQIGEEDSGLL